MRFLRHGPPDPNPLKEGREGLCLRVDDLGTLLVHWDDGRVLGVIVEDFVEVAE